MGENFIQSFRWFGPHDAVTLQAIHQTGATDIVTALHDIPTGTVWSVEKIKERRKLIEDIGLKWGVVESVNVHEDIKMGLVGRDVWIDNYIQTISNLAHCGVKTVCYNFMPVLDWTRTNLDFKLPNGASALRFYAPALIAFDMFILNRDGAALDFSTVQIERAKKYLDSLSREQLTRLENTILAGLPGTDEVFTLAEFKVFLERYANIGRKELKENLKYFLTKIIPEAEKIGVKMCVHPDDPPFPILGLPRVVCDLTDLRDVVNMYPSPSNGVTLCTGSLGANPENDLVDIIREIGENIHFLHLRNVNREEDGSFFEADHLNGSVDMYQVILEIINEQKKRASVGRADIRIPMRPDHGHILWTDFEINTYPGYSFIGRLKGLAELRGLEMGIRKSLDLELNR